MKADLWDIRQCALGRKHTAYRCYRDQCKIKFDAEELKSMGQKRYHTIMAVVIGICVGISTFLHLQGGGSTEEKLAQTSKNLNARLPMNVDSETRWDTTVSGPGNCLTYCYTLLNVSKSELDPDKVTAMIKPKLLLRCKANPEMKLFRQNHVTLRFLFKDKVGETVTSIQVSPDDL